MTERPAAPCDDTDRCRVRERLGREPQGDYEIAVRDDSGAPVVLRNAPFLDDGTPMPTTYWLIGPAETRRIARLEASGGVDAAEAAVDTEALVEAHARYATQRDREIPSDHVGPRPTGGVGGTRTGVKCLHAHWAWHLAGGDDPVGRWIAAQFATDARDDSALVEVGRGHTVVQVRNGTWTIPWGADTLTEQWLGSDDPPLPEHLTNALGAIDDHLDDAVRRHPELLEAREVTMRGPTIRALARVEVGDEIVPAIVSLERGAAEEIFRMVATEDRRDRAENPGLPGEHVDTIIATCCIVLAVMRRLRLDRVALSTERS